MKQHVEVETQTSVTQKISIGLVVATGLFVVLSAAVAAIYTLAVNMRDTAATTVSDDTTGTTTSDHILQVP